jgi:hypothetical protein
VSGPKAKDPWMLVVAGSTCGFPFALLLTLFTTCQTALGVVFGHFRGARSAPPGGDRVDSPRTNRMGLQRSPASVFLRWPAPRAWHLSMEIRHPAVFALHGHVLTDLFGSRRKDWQLQLGHSESSVLLAPTRFANVLAAGSFHFPVSRGNSRPDQDV